MARVDWTHLRVAKNTRDRLAVFMAKLATAIEQSQLAGNSRSEQQVTADYAINVLLDRDQAWRKRAAKARAKARGAKGRPADTPAVP